MDPFSRLSLDQLAQVLSHVDIKPRLSSCSLVSSTWRTAAARATTSVTVKHSTPSFGQWLRSHSVEVQVSSLKLTYSMYSRDTEMQLPLAQLGTLKELQLELLPWRPGPEAAYTAAQPRADLSASRSRSRSSSRQGLERLTALTHLQLTGRSVWLAGLSALTGLQELECGGVEPDEGLGWADAIPDLKTVVADLVAAFPQLQRLTSLTLSSDLASTAVVSQLSALQSLQRLQLDYASCDNIPALPQSLKWLTILCSEEGSLTTSNAAGLSQLTALQSLDLYSTRPLDLGLLASMRDLRSLQLEDCDYASAGGLQVVSSFTALTSLCIIRGLAPAASTIIAAEAGALTSSSQLAELTLSGQSVHLQLQDYASLFPPGRQLQHLTLLDISADLLSNPAAVRQAGSCCPNLLILYVSWPDMFSTETPWQAGE